MLESKPFEGIRKKILGEKAEKIGGMIYVLCLCILILTYNAGYTFTDMGETIPRILTIVKYAVFLVMLLNSVFVTCELSVRDMILIAVTGCVVLISFLRSNDSMLLTSLIVIIGAKGISLKKISKTFLYTYAFIMIATIALYLAGITADNTMIRENGMIRHSLGFVHPNMLGLCVLMIQLSYLMVRGKDISRMLFGIVSVGMALFVWFVPNSRAAFVCIVLAITVPFVQELELIRKKAISMFLASVPWIIALVSIIFTVIYDPSNRFMRLINKLSTGRISLANMMYSKIGFGGLLGSDMYQSVPDIYIDNAYCRLFLYFGTAVLAMFLAWYSYGIIRNLKYGNVSSAMVFVVMSLYGFFELFTLFAIYNPGLLVISAGPDQDNMEHEMSDRTLAT